MTDAIILRPVRATEMDALASLWHGSLASMTGRPASPGLTRARCAERLKTGGQGWTIVVATCGHRIRGFVAWVAGETEMSDGWLRELFVHPDAQGRGLGPCLLSAAKSAMPYGFWLRTPAGNTGARRFYAREGLKFDGLRQEDGLSFALAIYRWPGRRDGL